MLFVFLCTASVAAQDHLTPPEVLQKVQQKYTGISTATASFTQKMTLRFGRNEQLQSGSVKIKHGNRFLVNTPDQQLIANGTSVWIVSTANNQVLIDSFKENARVFTPEKFLLGLPDDFTVKEMKRENGLLKLSLEPNPASANARHLRSMTAWIRPGNWTVVRIAYIDRNRAQFDISLTDIRFNEAVNDSEFEFEPPAGMQVVDLRKVQ